MKLAICATLAGVMIATSPGWADNARGLLSEGTSLYGKGQFDKAAEAFGRAADAADAEKLDPAVANYNRANALMNQNQPEEALKAYTESLRTTDLRLQEQAYFNMGNAHMTLAENSVKMQKLPDAEKSIEEAIKMFANAMLLDPKDEDAKVNFELAAGQKHYFLNAIASAEDLLKRAQARVDQFDYVGTRDMLNQELPQQQIALALRKDLSEQFSTMVQNVNKVLKILEEAPVQQGLVPMPATGQESSPPPVKVP